MSVSRLAMPVIFPAILSVLALNLCSRASLADTYTGSGGLINDASVNTFDITVNDTALISHFDKITFTGSHTYVADLIFTLTHVDTGTSVVFINNVPSGRNLGGTYTFVTNLDSQTEDLDSFWRAASGASGEIDPPIESGTYAAATYVNSGGGEGDHGPASDAVGDGYTPTDLNIFAGENVSGVWRLTVEDVALQDTGNLGSWSFGVNTVVVPEASSLALVLPVLGMAGVYALSVRRKTVRRGISG